MPYTSALFVDERSCLTQEQKAALEKTAAAISTPGKGITACDEGPGTIGDRFNAVGIENTEENRRRYRQMLFEAPGCENYLSAAILDPETLYQRSDTCGKLFPELLTEKGIVPGVKPHLKVRHTLKGSLSANNFVVITSDLLPVGLHPARVQRRHSYAGP
jgi:hypothetical protein